MRLRVRPRSLPLLLLLLGALWAPVSGVAHGLAHSREAHHREPAHHDALHHDDLGHDVAHDDTERHGDDAGHHHVPPTEQLGAGVAMFSESDHHDGHADPLLDEGVPTRIDSPIAVLSRAPRMVIPLTTIVFAHERTTYAARPRADPHTGPPPTLRAPPTV